MIFTATALSRRERTHSAPLRHGGEKYTAESPGRRDNTVSQRLGGKYKKEKE